MHALHKDTLKEIINTKKRFISILLIVLLGVGFFAGIKVTSPDMQKIVDRYFDDTDSMDIEVISTLGLTDDDIQEIKNIEGVENVVGAYSKDVLIKANDEEFVAKVHNLSDDMNRVLLQEGRMPENDDECVVETSFLKGTSKNIGDTILLEESEDDTTQMLKNKEVKIVGTVASPLYISRERGSTKLASGKIDYYIYVPKTAFSSEIYTEIYLTVKDAKKQDAFSDEYEDNVKEIKDKIEAISDSRKEARYQSLKDEANKKVEEAEAELASKKQEADTQIADAEAKIKSAKNEIESGKKQLDQAEVQLVNSQKKANSEFAAAEKQLKQAEETIAEQEKNLQAGKEELQAKQQEAQSGIAQIEEGILAATQTIEQLEEQKKQLEAIGGDAAQISQIQAGIDQAQQTKNGLEQQKAQIQQQLQEAQDKITQGETQLNAAKQELQAQKTAYQNTKQQTNQKLYNAAAQIQKSRQELETAEQQIAESEQELANKKQEAETQIEEANQKIQEAKDQINDIKRPEWYILNRNQNVGFASYAQDTERIENLSKVFPVVFFVIAALISLTSMTRMVEEQRTQIGTLKALGYTKTQIASKYIIYAILATAIGGIIGMAIGFKIIPEIIIEMYRMMYTIPNIITEFNIKIGAMGLGVAMLCTVGATIYSCYKELTLSPAALMRPKSPKAGKRVILEKITWLWKKFSFTQKVTLRNLFRYKKRVLMTIIGILGCTALMVAGFGLRESVSNMIPLQYGEVFKYDINITFKNETSREEIKNGIQQIAELEEIQEGMSFNMQAVEILNIDNTQDIQMIVPENTENIKEYITLENRKTKQKYDLNNEGIIITEKLAKLLDIQEGDSITIKNADEKQGEVKVVGITRNYLMHYLYMSPELYKQVFEEEVKYNTMLAKENTGVIESEGNLQNIENKKEREEAKAQAQETVEDRLGKQILENTNISTISFTSQSKSIFDDVMQNMTFVVWILIVAAALLAFVVLYNLANVNISERIRELATIKVLGFYDKEVYDYVSRETSILTVIGILLGLVGGYFLNMFIIKTCELDILMFDSSISVWTYVYAAGLTVLFTGVVNVATYFALKKIDMIESLKSVE